MVTQFRKQLLEWYAEHRRDLPWRRTSDPYAIWVSEIMLQQTRVTAAIPYYLRFLDRFPSIDHLERTTEPELLSAWAGLGYYSRVRNMYRAARQMGGSFPSTYEAIRSLPGVGEYTAAAVSSIAFGLPHAAVDGNVLRVLSRVLNDRADISQGSVRKRFAGFAKELLDQQRPGDFNQAMMELGATVCLPKQPQCLVCPVLQLCEARAAGTQELVPVTRARVQTVRAHRKLFLIEQTGAVLLWQRPANSPKLAGFWELPEREHLMRAVRHSVIGEFRHSITNHLYTFDVAVAPSVSVTCKEVVNCAWIPRKSLKNVALSTTARKALALYERISPCEKRIEIRIT